MKSIIIEFPTTFPVTCHTDFVGPGTTFVAIQGTKHDGASFIPLALERGATTLVINDQVKLSAGLHKKIEQTQANLIRVPNCRRALAQLSAQALHYPAQKLKIIGVTGTKGKTTSVFLLEHILASLGYTTALLSTVYNKILQQKFPTTLTTQHPDYLHVFFDQCVKEGVDYVIMEAAAQAHTLDRTYGINFAGFLFTNFSPEHAEFYSSIEDYFFAKASLLSQTKAGAPIILNADSQRYDQLQEQLQKQNSTACSFGAYEADYVLKKRSSTAAHTTGEISYRGTSIAFCINLIGDFNCYNIAGVFALCHQLGINQHAIIESLKTFNHVPGRLEQYQLPNNAVCFIDYAHNPSSYESVLSTMRSLTHHLVVVCGAGGNRDAIKRPLMAAYATNYADYVIFTTDNPRSEDPYAIINDMVVGIAPENRHKYAIELDREQAIKNAYARTQPGSILMLLGKGAEEYQLIGDQKIYFNEREIIATLT